MSRTITAEAKITAKDATGNVFDKLAAKFKGIEKNAKALEGIKPTKFAGNLYDELHRLKLSERELQGVRRSFAALDQQLKATMPRASHYIRAVEEWKGKTVEHWRAVKSGVDEAEKSHAKFYKTAGKFGLHAAGLIGGSYTAERAFHSVAKHAAARNREEIREDMMGFSPDEKAEAERVANDISKKYPSLSRTDVMADLRKNTSRLGSFDRAKAVAKDYARARIMNQLSGGDEHELEQVVRAAEGAGAANTPDQFREFLNGFARAKMRNPDYTGEDFAKDFRAAGSAKYGLSKDYMENVFPVLASHTQGFGVKLGTANSALIGGRMTKQSRAAMKAAGLLDENGHLIDEREYQADPDAWTQHHIRPRMEAAGVHFGEHMSEEDKRTVSSMATKMFSAKNTADLIIAHLLDHPIVEKYRQSKSANIESADDFQKRDAGTAWESVKTQLGDLATAAANTSVAIGVMNKAAGDFANIAEFIRTGRVPATSPGLRRFLDWVEGNSPPIEGPIPLPRSDPRRTAEGERIPFPPRDPRDVDWESAGPVPLPTADPRRMRDGTRIPFPMPDPRNVGESWQPPAGDQTVKVEGEAKNTIEVHMEPSKWFEGWMQKVESAIQLIGRMNTNGPGSRGTSSPDAAAPIPRSFGGTGGQPY